MEQPVVLVVSAANLCRSPLAARLLSSAVELPVTSAGSRARAGTPSCPVSNFSIDHTAHRLEASHLRAAGLVLGITREHLRAPVALVPSVRQRAFTLLQAGRLARRLAVQGVTPPRGLLPSERLTWWVQKMHHARRDLLHGGGLDDDLPDPHAGADIHDLVIPALTASVAELVTVLAPSPATIMERPLA